jgi:hypothetical protein
MRQPLARQALVEADLMHDVDRCLLEHAGADPTLDIGAIAPLQHDAVDAGPMQQVGEEHSRRTCADDPDLRLHGSAMAGSGSPPGSGAMQLIMSNI